MIAAVMTAADLAHATVIGDTISAEYDFPSLGSPLSVLYIFPSPFIADVGSDAILCNRNVFCLDPVPISFSSTGRTDTVSFDFTSNNGFTAASFNGVVFTDLSGPDFGTVISSVGLPQSQIVSTGSTLSFNWQS